MIEVPKGKSGQVWHTTSQTRGRVMLLNVPPLLSLHRGTIYVPREVAEGDRLTSEEDKQLTTTGLRQAMPPAWTLWNDLFARYHAVKLWRAEVEAPGANL